MESHNPDASGAKGLGCLGQGERCHGGGNYLDCCWPFMCTKVESEYYKLNKCCLNRLCSDLGKKCKEWITKNVKNEVQGTLNETDMIML